MKNFFGEDLLLRTEAAKQIYGAVKALPIIDYHCHLDITKIADDASFPNVGELWLSGDHYKWRAMRLCGIDEKYITGDAPYREKFRRYAAILPKLAGNPLYYWTQMELASLFDIHEPLTAENADRIYDTANERLRGMKVSNLFAHFSVAYVATTDDPADDLSLHGTYGQTRVCPTFRPDRIFSLEEAYLQSLGGAAGVTIKTLDDMLEALSLRMDYFVERGCGISDHGFRRFPHAYADHTEAQALFLRREGLTEAEQDRLFGFLLVWLTREYARRNMLMQIHFGVIRNNNPQMFRQCGADAGFDLMTEPQSVEDLVRYFTQLEDSERPQTLLYPLNDNNLSAIAALTGAFRHVRIGAAWWFNDTVEGIRKNLRTLAEYAVLGTSPGMLTDSRSFSSYVRFDFFRRLLSDYLGGLVEAGEYALPSAVAVAEDICCYNIQTELMGETR